jgi:hypothetical protein
MRIKLFEEFIESTNEGMMSEIDVIRQESATREIFIADVKTFLKNHAANKKIADDEEFLNGLADEYFDSEGNKKELTE